MKIKSLIAFFFLVINFRAFTQEVGKTKNASDSLIINKYLELAKYNLKVTSNMDSVKYYSDKALMFAINNANEDGKVQALLIHAKFYLQQGLMDSAIKVYEGLSNLSGQLSYKYSPEIADGIGVCHYRTDRKEDALKYFMIAESGYVKNGNIESLGYLYAKMADISEMNQNYPESHKYKCKAISLIPKMKDGSAKLLTLNLLGSVYMYTKHLDKSYLDSARYYLELTLDLAHKLNDNSMLNTAYDQLATVYSYKGDFKKSMEVILKTIPYRKYLAEGEIVYFYMTMGETNYNLKDYNNALIYLDSMKQNLKYLQGNYYYMEYYEKSYKYHKAAGHFEISLQAFEKYKTLQDSLFGVEKSTVITELNKKYNKVENEVKISELNRQNEKARLNNKVLFLIVVTSVVFVIAAFIYHRKRMLDNKIAQMETEQRLNRARMNPHFFFNAMGSLQNLALNESKRNMVPSFISKFSKIMRQSLESTFNEMDTIENEVIFLTEYMELQKLRSENRFNYKFSMDESIEPNEMILPGMVLQPFVENAIEHGFKNMTTEGEINIEFKVSNNQLSVSISDNGEGINNEVKSKTFPSRATQIITDRLYLLNKQYKTNAKFALTANTPKGIKVNINLPVLYKS